MISFKYIQFEAPKKPEKEKEKTYVQDESTMYVK